MSTKEIRDIGLPPAQQALSDLWDEHVRDEFAIKDADAALDTMTPDAYVNHVPRVDRRSWQGRASGILCEALYSKDADRHRDRSDF